MVEPDLANFGQFLRAGYRFFQRAGEDGLVSAPEDELRCTFVAPARYGAGGGADGDAQTRYGLMAPAAELMLKQEWLHCDADKVFAKLSQSSAHPT